MDDIVWEKAQHCKDFKERLIISGSKMLVHNMEGDAIWVFGHDGQGRNKMGEILMRVRDCLLTRSIKSDISPVQ